MNTGKNENQLEVKNVILFNAIERSTTVCARFVDGYTSDWFFKLPAAFKDALDIKPTVKQIDKVQYTIITQGTLYSFKKGDVLYDSISAYTKPWAEALKEFTYMIQVESAMSDSYQSIEDWVAESKGDKFKVTVNKPLDGHVEFKLYKSDGEKIVLEKIYKSSQKEFVRLLQIGEFFQSNLEIIKIF